MLQQVDLGEQKLERYGRSAGRDAIDRLRQLARPLAGARVLHLNATPYGGGVAEILRSEVPLLRDLGLAADWKLITGDQAFFTVTKMVHNALQGAKQGPSPEQWQTYMSNSARNAELLEEKYDVVVVHDPQPLALLQHHGKGSSRWIWRCHIDTSEPNLEVWNWLRAFLDAYDRYVFTMAQFIPPGIPGQQVVVIPPAIDPESPKNVELDGELARRILGWIGIEAGRPLVTQISRFDPWKDPLGVIAAYRLVRSEVPDCQLALVGSMALDDPEGWEVYRQIEEASRGDPQIHLFTNLSGVGNIEVNAFQRLASVAIQKSIREGFGLVVSETLWKGTPVVATKAGGIPLQLEDGMAGYLVEDTESCAARVIELLRNPEKARAMGKRGRERVRQHFLLPRLIEDELRLYASVLAGSVPSHPGMPDSLTSSIANR